MAFVLIIISQVLIGIFEVFDPIWNLGAFFINGPNFDFGPNCNVTYENFEL